MGAPIKTEVKEDNFYILGPAGQVRIPNWPMPPLMSNHGNYIVSMANVCRWLASVAEGLGVEIFPGMAASELVYDGDRVVGRGGRRVWPRPGDGEPGPNYEPGMELRGKYVFLSEGVRGSLAKEVIAKYDLSKGPLPAEVRHRHEGNLGDRPRQAPAGHRHPYHGLAAGSNAGRRVLHLSH
jgi:electron-transferring-flavoprotein dehydrogenase